MKQIGPGILPQSEIYFSSPSPKAKKLYYNVLCAGHFYCDGNYHLARENYDSILILFVLGGSFTFVSNDGTYVTAAKNDTVILDCCKPHEYFTKDSLESIWIHIDGANIRQFFQEISETNGNLIRSKDAVHIKKLMFGIFEGIGTDERLEETELSVEIHRLLLKLLNPVSLKENSQSIYSSNIQNVKDYISAHLNENITVNALAKTAHMSQTHFSRLFKQQTGFSPYDYVLITRLNKAKEYLLKTDMTVAEIAYETGFNSQANFVYFFTGNEGISPGKFRKLNF